MALKAALARRLGLGLIIQRFSVRIQIVARWFDILVGNVRFILVSIVLVSARL